MLSRLIVPIAAVLVVACSVDLDLPSVSGATLKGRLDTQGHVAPGNLTLRLINVDSRESLEVITDADGSFVRSDIKTGVWSIAADLPGFVPLREGPFNLTSGALVDAGVLKPVWLAQTPQRGSVKGRVVVRGGETSQLDGGRPADAAGAKVECVLGDATGQVLATAVVDAFGEFWLEVPPGVYTLRATHPFYVAALRSGLTVTEARELDLSANPLVMDLNPAELSGSVLRELDLRTDTLPATGAVVVSDTGVTATVDATGNFRLTNLPAGNRGFTISLAGHLDPAAERRFSLVGGERRVVAPTIVKLLRGALTGEVEMADNSPLDQVTVSVPGTPYATQAAPSTTNPAQGRWVLSGLPVGSTVVRASRPGYIAATSAPATVDVGPAREVPLLRLTRVQGDFAIDDGDAANLAGFTRTENVDLVLTNVMNAADYRKVEGSLAALSSAPWQPYAVPRIPHTLTTGDGLKTVYLQFRDSTGNESAPLQGSVFLDQTAPSSVVVALASGQDFTRASNPLPVELTADEAGSGLADMLLSASASVAPDGGRLLAASQRYQRDYSFTRPALADGGVPADGPFRLYAQVVDNAGNQSAVVFDDTTVDTIAPTGTVRIAKGARATVDGYTDTAQVILEETFTTEPFSGTLGIRLANDLTGLATASVRAARATEGWVLDPGGAAAKSVHYQFIDGAGNVSAPATANITFDVTPPQVVVTLNSAASTSDRVVHLTVQGSDDAALSPTHALTVSESALFSGATPVPLPLGGAVNLTLGGTDGVHTIYVRMRDAAGNDTVDDSVRVVLDQTPPVGQSLALTGTLADGTPSSDTTSTAVVTVTLVQSGATRVRFSDATQVSCSGGGFVPLTSNVVINHPLPGSGAVRTVTACLADDAGNTAGPLTASIDVDGAAPTSCALVLKGRRADGTDASAALDATALRDISFTLSGCSDTPAEVFLTEASTVNCAASNLVFVPYNSLGTPLSLSVVDGIKTVRGCVRDSTRNATSFVFDSITLDTTPPTGGTVLIDSGAAFVNAGQVTSRGGYRADLQGSATGAFDWAYGTTSTPNSFTTTFTVSQYVFGGGDGTKTIYAIFRDELGNSTAATTISDSIVFDTAAPLLGTASVSVIGPTQNDYTNTQVVTVRIANAPGDAATVKFLERATVGTCVAADVTPAQAFPVLAAFTLSLSPAEALKRVCLQFFDSAGNGSSMLSDDVTLDRTPPTTPQLTTPEQYVSLGDNAPFTVNTASPSLEPSVSFARYEKLGGKTTAWATASTTQSDTSFLFNLQNPGNAGTAAEEGVRNELRLRAVDLAGNTSGESVVFITADINPPDPVPSILDTYVDNATGRGTVHWLPSPSQVAGYRLYYGTTSTSYNGTYANEGNSPIDIGNRLSFTLSGLTNDVITYVRIAPYDRAGNFGVQTPSGFGQGVAVLPGAISPIVVADVTWAAPPGGAVQQLTALAQNDEYLYMLGKLGTDCAGAAASCSTTLRTVDLSRLESPIQRGFLRPDAGVPEQVGNLMLLGAEASTPSGSHRGAVLVDGPWLYAASGRSLYVLSLSNPGQPSLAATIDFGALNANLRVTAIEELAGSKLIVGGDDSSNSAAFSALVDISKLHDNNVNTRPTSADVQWVSHPAGSSGAFPFLVATQLVHTRGSYSIARLSDGLTGGLWNSSDVQAGTDVISGTGAHHKRSGNVLVSVNFQGLSVTDVLSMYSGGLAASPVGSAALSNGLVFDFVGRSVFVPIDSSSPLLYDVTVPSAPVLRGRGAVTTGSTYGVAKLWGPYAIVAGANTGLGTMSLKVFELATPRGMALKTLVPGALGAGVEHRGELNVVAGQAYASAGQVFDLLNATPVKAQAANGCEVSTAWFGDSAVGANGNMLTVTHLEQLTDRSGSTGLGTDDRYLVPLDPLARSTGVAAWGNFLVVAELRSDGVWLEVFDARKVRDRLTTTKLSSSDVVFSALAIPLTVLPSHMANVTMNGGIAAVSLSYGNNTTVTSVQFFDLRQLFDDDATTVLAPGAGYAGALTSQKVWKTVVRGGVAYFAGLTGFGAAAVPELFDGNAGTTVPTDRNIDYRSPQYSSAADLKVYGTRAYVGGSQVSVIDVSDRSNLQVVAQSSIGGSPGFCTPQADSARTLSPGLDVAGPELYLNSGHFGIFDLE